MKKIIHFKIKFIITLLFLLFSGGSAFSIQVTSTPKSEIAEGQFYNYKLQLDKVMTAGSFTVVEKPSWLNFDASTQFLYGIANATYGANSVKITITDGSATINHNFTINVRRLNELPKIITDYIDPTKYPEYKRRKFPTPTWETFHNKVQFVGGRLLSGFQWENPDSKFGPVGDRPVAPRWSTGYGSVFWPGIRWFSSMGANPATDVAFQTAMTRMKDQGIYLFNVGGYGPGSPFRSSFGMLKLPENYRDALQSKLGDSFLGFDVGEQDGRYLMVMSKFNQNNSTDRFQSYLNFHNYIKRISDDLGNKTSLLSVQWGWHYQAKNNDVYIVGAESQPKSFVNSNSLNYMMLRGVARTYGLPLFGNVSVFCSNSKGVASSKAYGITGDTNGPTKGNSLNLMRRMMFSQYLYNAAILGFEGNLFEQPALSTQKETPISEIHKQMFLYVQANPRAGVMHAPVAVLQDFLSGWIPKGGFTPLTSSVTTFGTNPWDSGDWQTHYVINKIYPDYEKNGEDDTELGGQCNTPFGDMADGLLTDASKEVLSRYGLIIFSGQVRELDTELKDKINYYINQGGNLVITARVAQKLFPQWLNADDSWTKVTNPTISFTSGVGWPTSLEQNTSFVDTGIYLLKDKLTLPAGSQILASSTINSINRPLVARINVGKGSVILSLSEFGITPSATQNGLLPLYSQLLSMELTKQQLFSVGNAQLSFVTNRLDSTNYTVGVFNNSLSQKTFQISSKIGSIQSINEEDLTMGRTHISSSIGYWPELYQTNNGGTNTATTIMGGDVRFFKIRLSNPSLVNALKSSEMPYSAFPTNRYLYLPTLNNLEQKILSWKTMLNSFEGVMLDWGELLVADKATIKKNASWLNLQNLKVTIDFSRGFDDSFKLIANDENSRSEMLERLKNVFDKMNALFSNNASNVIFQIPSGIENAGVVNALDLIAKEAAKFNINLLVYNGKDVANDNCLAITNLVSQNNSNIKYLLNTANFSNIESGISISGNQLGAVMISPENVQKNYASLQNLNSNILQIYNFNFSTWESAYNVLTSVTQKTDAVNFGISGFTKPDLKDVVGEISDNYKTSSLSSGYYLTFRNITDIKREALAIADTLFAYYGGVMLEAKYLATRDSLSLLNDRRWLTAKGLKVVVDLSQELNSFPDLCWFEYPYEAGRPSNTDRMLESQVYMKKVVTKMQIIGAENIIIGAHNGPENDNGYSIDQFAGIERFVTYCKSKSIKVHYQNNEFNKNAEGGTYNNSLNVDKYIDSLRINKGLNNLNFATNSINTLASNSSLIYYPTKAPLGTFIIGGSSSNKNRVPLPINYDTRIDITGIDSYTDALKILDGGYEINKTSFAKNAGDDARYLGRIKNIIKNNIPSIVSTPITKLGTGNYSYTIVATDIDNDLLTYRKAILPSWLNFDPINHSITGTAPQSAAGKTFPVKILVSDGTTEVSQSFSISVDAASGYSVNNALPSEISVYPNPAKENATIFIGNNANQINSIQLTDLIGRQIQMLSIDSSRNGNIQVSLKDIPNQLGLIKIEFKDGQQLSLKLFIQK
jgi:hypothetical protein